MKFVTLSLLLTLLTLFNVSLYAKEREPSLRLVGKVKEGVPKKVAIKELSKGLHFVEEKVYNPYEKRTDLYGGVLLNDFVAKYGAKDVVALEIIALDDYTIEITKTEWNSLRIILSTHMNKEYIPIKNKGPLRIVFPDYDSMQKQYQDNIASWVWMIKKIKFK